MESMVNNPDDVSAALFLIQQCAAAGKQVIVKQDTRFYVHLPSDRMQIVHPMIRRFLHVAKT